MAAFHRKTRGIVVLHRCVLTSSRDRSLQNKNSLPLTRTPPVGFLAGEGKETCPETRVEMVNILEIKFGRGRRTTRLRSAHSKSALI